MYELHHLRGNTYYVDGPTNCGVYVLNEKKEALLFDCGTEEDAPHIYKAINMAGIKITYLVFLIVMLTMLEDGNIFIQKHIVR